MLKPTSDKDLATASVLFLTHTILIHLTRNYLRASIPGEIMVLGASCVSPRPQLKREQSPKPEFGWIPANLRDLSKG